MTDRDKYRDNDDIRDPTEDRAGTKPDTKAEARGDARDLGADKRARVDRRDDEITES